jgi:P pilus assembly chaperone PapD
MIKIAPSVVMRRFKKMKRIILIISILFITNLFSQPKIEVIGSKTYDFGEIYQGKKVKHIFEIKNSGNKPLVIQDVRSSCGCTVPEIDRKSISERINPYDPITSVAPGKTAKVSAEFSSGGFEGMVTKVITIVSNDIKNPNVDLQLTGKIYVDVQVPEKYFVFQNAKLGQTYNSTITLKNITDKTINIVGVKNEFKEVKIKISNKALLPQKDMQVVAELVPARPGLLQGNVVIKTDSKRQPEIEIKVWGVVSQPQ